MSNDPPTSLGACPVPEPLSDAEIRRIARMSRLLIDDAHIEELRHELRKVLGWAAMLETVDREDLSEDTPGAKVRLDEDLPGSMLGQEVLRDIAPAVDGPFVRVPKVLGGGGA